MGGGPGPGARSSGPAEGRAAPGNAGLPGRVPVLIPHPPPAPSPLPVGRLVSKGFSPRRRDLAPVPRPRGARFRGVADFVTGKVSYAHQLRARVALLACRAIPEFALRWMSLAVIS